MSDQAAYYFANALGVIGVAWAFAFAFKWWWTKK